MKKKTKIILSCLLVLLICALSFLCYSNYKLFEKRTHGPVLEKTYYSKDELSNDYNSLIYPRRKINPLLLNEECALKEYGIKYNVQISYNDECCIGNYLFQTFYVYDETLGYDSNSDGELNYSFKIVFNTYTLMAKEFYESWNDEYEFCDKTNDNDWYTEKLMCLLHGYYTKFYSATFYTNLTLDEEYCENFVRKNLIYLLNV